RALRNLGEASWPAPLVVTLSPNGPYMLVPGDAFDGYLAIEDCWADDAKTFDHEKFAHDYGGKEGLDAAKASWNQVIDLLQPFHASLPSETVALISEQWLREGKRRRRARRPSRPTVEAARAIAIEIARQEGVPIDDVVAYQQGTRSERHDRAKRPR